MIIDNNKKKINDYDDDDDDDNDESCGGGGNGGSDDDNDGSDIAFLSSIECKHCLITTSYMTGLLDIFTLLHTCI